MVKRQHQRVVLTQPVNLETAGMTGQGTTVNFSPGGCAIQQKDLALFCGRRLTMRLVLPDCPEPLEVGQVTVAWTKDDQCGIRFMATSQDVQERLSQVYELLIKAQTEVAVLPVISLASAIGPLACHAPLPGPHFPMVHSPLVDDGWPLVIDEQH